MSFFSGFSDVFNFINDPLDILPEDVYTVLFDPLNLFQTPDAPPSLGTPDVAELSITTATEGTPIPDLNGTSKYTGNIIQYWGGRNEAITQQRETGGKGGGSDSVTETTGYNYFLSWKQALIQGSDEVKLYTIFKGDDIVWWGDLSCPEGGVESIILWDIIGYHKDEGIKGTQLGTVHFHFGTEDQTVHSSAVGAGTYDYPHRGLCYALFDDFALGTSNRVPVYKFVVGKYPVLSFNSTSIIGTYFYNGAHSIWYIYASMLGIPEDMLDADSFSAVADTLISENFGIGINFDKEASAEAYIESILFHIRGESYYETDGKIHLDLLRKDVELEDMGSISDDDVLQDPTVSRSTWEETNNELKGNYPLMLFIGVGNANYTNEYVEVLRQGFPSARLTNEYVEVLRSGVPSARITNEYVEVLRQGFPSARLTNEYVEVLQEY